MAEKVWYRSGEGSTIDDRGTLTVGGGAIRFAGRKSSLGGPVRAVRSRRRGLTDWVVVTYEDGGEPHDAYFVCSRLLGWGGILGANKKLQAAVEAGIPAQA